MMDRCRFYCAPFDGPSGRNDREAKRSVVLPAKAGTMNCRFPSYCTDCRLDFHKDWWRFTKTRYDLISVESSSSENQNDWLFTVNIIHNRVGLWGLQEIWWGVLQIVQTLLDQSAFLHNFPVPEESGHAILYSFSITAEIYFCAAADLCRQGEQSIEPNLKTKIKPAPSAPKQAILFFAIRLLWFKALNGETHYYCHARWVVTWRNANQTSRILVTAANYAAMTVVAQKVQKKNLGYTDSIDFEKRENNVNKGEPRLLNIQASMAGRRNAGVKVHLYEHKRRYLDNCIVFANEYSFRKISSRGNSYPSWSRCCRWSFSTLSRSLSCGTGICSSAQNKDKWF